MLLVVVVRGAVGEKARGMSLLGGTGGRRIAADVYNGNKLRNIKDNDSVNAGA